MSSKISKDVEKILGGIQKADDELSIDDIEQLTMNLNFLKKEILAQDKKSIENFLSNLDGKESIYLN